MSDPHNTRSPSPPGPLPDPDFWKRKLLAFLHDPPHKPFQIIGHEDARKSLLLQLGLDETDHASDFDRRCDWCAAAADRFAFPRSQVLRSDWRANDLEFRHPLCGSRITKRDYGQGTPATAAVGEDWVNRALSGIPKEDADWKAQFIRVWRLWPERCAREWNPLLAYAVADTRIPDHTIWHHNAVASAFASAGDRPAFLMFQIGPVQDFIKQARKLLDLWAGSYLLSYLIAQGMLAIAEEIGPDTIVYPNLRCVPLADWHWFRTGRIGEPQRASHANELLTPNLPNRFLALVPAERAASLAGSAETAVRNAWKAIAKSVHAEIARTVGATHPGWDCFWDNQVARFPVVDWEVHEWPTSDQALAAAAGSPPVPPVHGGWGKHPLRLARQWMDEMMPAGDREPWQGNENAGFAWALHYAALDWKFAARKTARPFAPWNQPDGTVPKDDLNGRDEILGGTDKTQWEPFWEALRKAMPGEFKGRQRLGAISVVKRLFHKTYLGTPPCVTPHSLGWDELIGQTRPAFESVPEIAQIDKAIDAEEEVADKYYAVLAMDGDSMGEWVSGTRAPTLVSVLAREAQDYLRQHWNPARADGVKVDEARRPLSPGYHAALSEALGNFALYAARQIVEAFSGQLIYAGGDDVLAMLPAATALDCAQALQIVFRGLDPHAEDTKATEAVKAALSGLFTFPAPGFIRCREAAGKAARLRPNWPLMMPGATASVGIAVGHVHAPMQDVIQAARDAESVAKKVPRKAAFCLSILKRSGESAVLSAPWDSGVTGVWDELSRDIHGLTGRFPYRVVQLLKPLLECTGQDADEGWEPAWTQELRICVAAEIAHALRNQTVLDKTKKDAADIARRWCAALQDALPPKRFVHFWMAWAFMERIKPENQGKEGR